MKREVCKVVGKMEDQWQLVYKWMGDTEGVGEV